ncbi:QueT transporter family protein [Candidatus Avoscillospira sp. LCP25S3_F1]|uniref:QueT transporter family protein n=1 Tax=Candidatus Avoscillospira sp. LCP25S3_F1 TaxID=3438825 RepID=UPI003F907C7F
MKKLTTRDLAFCGVIAALYAVITLAIAPFAYGPVQFRISEALCVLPFFAPVTSLGLFIGCLVANLFSSVTPLDTIIGSAATLLGCLWTAKLRTKWLTPLPTTIVNGVMVGAMLAAVYTPDAFWQGFLVNGLQVAAGELAVMVILGLPLAVWLEKSKVLKRLTLQVRTFA